MHKWRVGSCPRVLRVSFSHFPEFFFVLDHRGRLGRKVVQLRCVFMRNLRTVRVAYSPHSLAGLGSQWRGCCAYRPAPSDGEHQETTWSQSLGTSRECHPTFQLIKHWDYRSRHQSVDDLTAIGSAALVVLATAGSTNSVRTISAHLLTYGRAAIRRGHTGATLRSSTTTRWWRRQRGWHIGLMLLRGPVPPQPGCLG